MTKSGAQTTVPNDKGFIKNFANIYLHPCVVDEKPTFVYEKGLKHKNSIVFECLRKFSEKLGITLLEDRREDFVEGVKRVKDPKKSLIYPLVLLIGIMAASPLPAYGSDHFQSHGYQIEETQQSQVMEEISLDSHVDIKVDDLMQLLLKWLSNRTELKFDVSAIPSVQRASNDELINIAFSNNVPKAADVSALNIFGLYNFKTNTIFLRGDVDLKSPEGKAILLHELVHFVQYQNHLELKVDSVKGLEALAYMLEANYLSNSGYVINFTNSVVNVQ